MNKKTLNKLVGNTGETIAADYLRKNGFDIIVRNFTCKQGEIDIIARRGNHYHFIEVKSRTSNNFGGGRAAVTATKRNTIRTVATYYLVKNKLFERVGVQFDVIEITGQNGNFQIEHLPNCF